MGEVMGGSAGQPDQKTMMAVDTNLVRPPATKSKVTSPTLNAPQAWSHLVIMLIFGICGIFYSMSRAGS